MHMDLAPLQTSAHAQRDGQAMIVISHSAQKSVTTVVHALLRIRASVLLNGLAEPAPSRDVLV